MPDFTPVKCKNCDNTESLHWENIDGKWKLIRDLDGNPHNCPRNKVSEISSSSNSKKLDTGTGYYPDGVTEKLKSSDPDICQFRGSYRENRCFRRRFFLPLQQKQDIYCEMHGYTMRAHSGGIKEKFIKREEKLQDTLGEQDEKSNIS